MHAYFRTRTSQISKIKAHFCHNTPKNKALFRPSLNKVWWKIPPQQHWTYQYGIQRDKEEYIKYTKPGKGAVHAAPVLARYSISQGGRSQSFLFCGVTTQYFRQSSSDLNNKLLELQCKTKLALEASWEEDRHVKAKVESHREIVTNLERELTRLWSEPIWANDKYNTTPKITPLTCFIKWSLSSLLMLSNLWLSSAAKSVTCHHVGRTNNICHSHLWMLQE